MTSIVNPHKEPQIVVVCTGNVCRSPMAEAFISHFLREKRLCANVSSRGLAAPIGRPPHPYAIEAAESLGIQIQPEKCATPLVSYDVMAATVILVMDSGHRQEMGRRFPTSLGKIFLLGQWENQEIIDPIDEPREVFHSVAEQILKGAQSWVQRLEQAGILRSTCTTT